MALDPKKFADWEIAREAEKNMKTITQLGKELGLTPEEVLPYGHHMGKVDFQKILQRTADKPNGKFINVTAITPTLFGEGKSTTTIGLLQGLGKRGLRVSAAIRQPSGGPTMGSKGSAAGGGLAQCIPLTEYSLGFTGDINAIANAHNLGMVALTARMQHERNYDDTKLEQLSGKKRFDIDPTTIPAGFVMDFCCQALRHIIIGLDSGNGRTDGYMMSSRFDIAVSSEVMAIFSIAKDLKDLRERIGKMILAYNKVGKAVTAEDLGVAGAMTAWLVEALKPNLIQSLEGQPVFVHAGPFANIALGQSSVIADRVALKLTDYHITESGFGAEVGFEKFCNLKYKYSGLAPDAAVIVATVRALKYHGGGATLARGRKLSDEYTNERVDLVEKGCENLLHHANFVKSTGVPAVVCLNAFAGDHPAEIAKIREICEKNNIRMAVSQHWEKGGDGALELADAVIEACNEKSTFKPSYSWDMSYSKRIELIAKEIYGADGVDFSPKAKAMLEKLEKETNPAETGICMAKTPASISDKPELRNVPKGWTLSVRDVLHFGGAGFLAVITGSISLMPGTGSTPAYYNIDVDTETGEVHGIF